MMVVCALTFPVLAPGRGARAGFTTFESGPVRPLARSPDGTRLFACNIPDGRVDVFRIGDDGSLTAAGSVAVGLEPVAVAARNDGEIWVVNHLSDSVSVVDVSTDAPRVVRTLLVGDEPRDIVFAGPGARRAFVTTARRGQHLPPEIPPRLTTPGTPRALVWVFDATDLGASLEGTPVAILELFADTPRALAVAPDGGTVYAAAFLSGNQTTTLSEGVVCDGGASAPACGAPGASYPGGLPAPNANRQGIAGPETGLIVKFDGAHWRDSVGRVWDDGVRFSLPDQDVFAIDASADPPRIARTFAHVGTVLFDMVANPVTGVVYVSNTEARNDVRFEGPGGGGSTVRGHLAESRITLLDDAGVRPRHLNPHIDYAIQPSPLGTAERSLATPLGMAVSRDGGTLYLAAFGSDVVAVLDTGELESGVLVPSAAQHIPVSGGPSGLVLDEERNRLYVATRFDDAIAVIDVAARAEVGRIRLHDPEPPEVVGGRPVLYDARATSSNGEAACASCHVFGDLDGLAWDLGNPDDDVQANPNPFHVEGGDPSFHPLKGPMTTQSLRGLANHGPMHWRGDRTGGSDPGGDPLAEEQAFGRFSRAFDSLLGRGAPIVAADMERLTRFVLRLTYPPNPVRNLDGSLTAAQQAGRDRYFGPPSRGAFNCNSCHVLALARGFFGSDGTSAFQIGPQPFKIPHLRNAYAKVGMFGMPGVPFLRTGDDEHAGPQVRGFGFMHDGSVDTLFRFHGAQIFTLSEAARAELEEFVLAYDSNLAPIVGQQITLAAGNAGVVGSRVDLLIARADAGECDLIAKGVVDGEARGFLYGGGLFHADRAAEPARTDAELRSLAARAAGELTYTCLPPASGARVGLDRDEDGFLDRDELDAGTNPDDPHDPRGTPVPSPFPSPQAVSIGVATRELRMSGGGSTTGNSARRLLRFRALTGDADPGHRIQVPARGGTSDPRIVGGSLRVYNAAGLAGDDVERTLVPGRWKLIGRRNPVGFRYRAAPEDDDPVRRVIVERNAILVQVSGKGWAYTLDESAQGRVGVVLRLGTTAYCAEAPAMAGGRLPDRARLSDRVNRFVGERDAPPPSCPPAP